MGVGMVAEGLGQRAVGRLLGCQYETVGKLVLDIGEGYAHLHNALFRRLRPKRIEADEIWSFVHTKQGNLEAGDPEEHGDQFTFMGIDADNKAILAYHVGKRTKANTHGFILDLASRVLTLPQITTDGFDQYPGAILGAFGPNVPYAQQIKRYEAQCSTEAAIRYQAARVVRTEKRVISGDPDPALISTAYIERENGTMREHTARFSRATKSFSKDFRHHYAAVDLYVGYYNFVLVHETLKTTPAVAIGVADEPWDLDRYVYQCWLASKSWGAPERPGSDGHGILLSRRFRDHR